MLETRVYSHCKYELFEVVSHVVQIIKIPCWEAKQTNKQTKPGFSLRILVAGERCNVIGEYFENGSTSEL